MKREELEKLGITDKDMLDKIMAMNGQDIEKHKKVADDAANELTGVKGQLGEANKQIEAFKGMDIEGIKKAASDWEKKATDFEAAVKQAQSDAAEQAGKLKFEHALEKALGDAKAKNVTAVRALLKVNDLKLSEEGAVLGLTEQLEQVKKDNDYLFESSEETPQITASTKTGTSAVDPVIAAARAAAGLSTKTEK